MKYGVIINAHINRPGFPIGEFIVWPCSVTKEKQISTSQTTGWERKRNIPPQGRPLFCFEEAIAYHAAWVSSMEKPFCTRERPPSPMMGRKITPWVKKSIREAIEVAGGETN